MIRRNIKPRSNTPEFNRKYLDNSQSIERNKTKCFTLTVPQSALPRERPRSSNRTEPPELRRIRQNIRQKI